MHILLCAIFFISGAAALIFEIIWFQLSGITFGNSVWASSIVLASFMGGLALGNGLSARFGNRIKKPVRFYAYLEICISITGFALVIALPYLSHMLSPVFSALFDNYILLNSLRLIVSFFLMLIPATAMGATLPVLVKALYEKRGQFGRILGALYGWNTLGAVFGVIFCEFVLIQALGLQGSGAVAASLNTIAAALALWIDRKSRITQSGVSPPLSGTVELTTQRTPYLLAASFLCGFALLALEVIWFRFLLMFYMSTSWSFAIMLLTVLLGISAGGLIASVVFRKFPKAHIALPHLIVLNGILVVILYGNFDTYLALVEDYSPLIEIALSSLFLILPVCLLSGTIYTFLGKQIFLNISSETKTTGMLTLANTIGGMFGSLVGGMVLLPLFGVEKSFFALTLFYGLAGVIVCLASSANWTKKYKRNALISFALYGIVVGFFPFGFMKDFYLDRTLPAHVLKAEKRIGYKEGLTETIQYLERELLKTPRSHRLVTNSYSMSGTNLRSKRYMKFFVYLPVALNPSMRDALLIAYGCGSTAKALSDTKQLEKIDVVDISRDILEMSSLIYKNPQEHPLNDKRVNVFVEDGRFFLSTTQNKYDLITAEPPPPKNSGIVNLYTQEYFQLIFDALKPGGMATYWLPVYQMRPEETKSILKAFGNVFKSNSLWTAAELEWMMVGVKSPLPKPEAEVFRNQWHQPKINAELQTLGFISPGQLGSFFIADSVDISGWVKKTQPLNDNFPHRLLPDSDRSFSLAPYYSFMDPANCQARFRESQFIKDYWPEPLKTESVAHFAHRATIDRLLAKQMPSIVDLHNCLFNESLSPYILWAFRSDQAAQNLIQSIISRNQLKQSLDDDSILDTYRHMAAGACQYRNYKLAENYLELATSILAPQAKTNDIHYPIRAYLSYLIGNRDQAQHLLSTYVNLFPPLIEKRKKIADSIWTFLNTLDFQRKEMR